MTAASGGQRAEQGRRLLDEAVRLLDAVQSTDRQHAREQTREQGREETHGPDCGWCPVCRGVAALRELDPEAVSRVATAVGDLAGAVRDLLSGSPSGSRPDSRPDSRAGGASEPPAEGQEAQGEGPPPVQRIVVGE